MDWMYLFYFLLGTLIFFGAEYAGRGRWNDEFTSLPQTKALQGVMVLFVALHHMGQKTCGSWHPRAYTVHGLDVFVPVGYLFVGVFFFCSGLGLYRSLKTKPDYLKGFCRRRILSMVIAFYLSEIIYTLVRLAMGQKMDLMTALWYLSGLHMANFNAWFLVTLPFFYLAFYLSFRFCRREGAAIFLVFLFTLGYTVLGAFIGRQDGWWMGGEWWYNSILLFPLGLLFGKHEQRVTGFLKKGYWFFLAFSLAAVFGLFFLSEWVNGSVWGYFDPKSNPMRVPHRLMSAGLQWLVALLYTACWFLMMMKVKLGNKALAWLGSVTLEFYLMHGMFVEMFGFSFLDEARSIVYIRSVPLYIAAVLACSVLAAVLFNRLRLGVTGRLLGPGRDGRRGPSDGKDIGKKRIFLWRGDRPERTRKISRFFVPFAAAAVLLVFALTALPRGDGRTRVMSGLSFRLPENYVQRYSDSRYAVWEYKGTDMRPGNLILDADIRDGNAQNFSTVEKVLEACDWLAGAELYVNPQGVRMVRGFADYAEGQERRYYIESAGSVVLMCMHEDERFYSPEDCEKVLLEVAQNVRPAK